MPGGYLACPEALMEMYRGQPMSYTQSAFHVLASSRILLLVKPSYQVSHRVQHGGNRRITERLPEFAVRLSRNARAKKVLLSRITLGQTELRAGLGDEDLVLEQVSS